MKKITQRVEDGESGDTVNAQTDGTDYREDWKEKKKDSTEAK